jgi:hypothetical protein
VPPSTVALINHRLVRATIGVWRTRIAMAAP